MSSESGCAILNRETNVLDLFDDPRAIRKQSAIEGELISIAMADEGLRYIDVIDSARGEFNEPT